MSKEQITQDVARVPVTFFGTGWGQHAEIVAKVKGADGETCYAKAKLKFERQKARTSSALKLPHAIIQTPMSVPAGSRLGPYEIVGPIGAGGMGEVYKARDTRLDRSVAIKILPAHLSSNPDLKARFEREARVISSLNHPNICTLHDVGEHPLTGDSASEGDPSISYLVMELCDGQTLAERLEKGPLPIEQVLRIAIQIADGLDRAHRAGVVHRDLKPGNIMLTKSGAKLLDFGLAKSSTILGRPDAPGPIGMTREDATVARPLTQEGTILGTFQYMAPEQLEGRDVDARSDIFAFGAIVYEMVSGRRAFDGKTKASLIASILDREPPPLSDAQPLTPPALDRVMRTCLAKDPDDRWQSAHDLKRELEWIRDGISSPSTTAPAVARRRTHERLAWILAAILPIAAIAATWAWTRAHIAKPPRLIVPFAPPPGTQFFATGDAGGPITLSPDGRYATFATISEKGSVLWLQSLENGTMSILPGTENASFPFWSPDSRSIGFFMNARLNVIDIDGSTPRAIAEAPDGRGGAWGADGQIVFAPFTQAGISRVAASGGPVVRITTPVAPYSTHRWPSFLPDSKHFVYVAANHDVPEGPDTALFIASIDGKTSRKLTPSIGSGVVWHDYLLYLKSNKLVAQRLRGEELTGPVIPVSDNVLYDAGTWRSIVSTSDNGMMAIHSGAVAGAIPLRWFDRTGKVIGEIGPPELFGGVAVSPDGSRVAMTIGDPRSTVYIHDIARGVRTRLSFVEGGVRSPMWSRDGKNVVFVVTVTRPTVHFALCIQPADGSSRERTLFESPDILGPTDFTLDGSLIFCTKGSGMNSDIIAVPVAGGPPSVVVGGPNLQREGRLSPDGKWLLYCEADASGRAIFLTRYPSRTGKWQVSNDWGNLAWWNPNGKEIFYFSNGVKSVPVTLTGNSVQLGEPVRLFTVNINTNNTAISMSPDATRFLVVVAGQSGARPATLITNFGAALEK